MEVIPGVQAAMRGVAAAKRAAARPGVADGYLRRLRSELIARRNAVWQQPADPDELLRHVEAACYEAAAEAVTPPPTVTGASQSDRR